MPPLNREPPTPPMLNGPVARQPRCSVIVPVWATPFTYRVTFRVATSYTAARCVQVFTAGTSFDMATRLVPGSVLALTAAHLPKNDEYSRLMADRLIPNCPAMIRVFARSSTFAQAEMV